MREILFKAKRIDNGELIEGFLYPGIGIDNGKWIITAVDSVFMSSRSFEVDPSSICQCTGFFDEYGKEIFEGDIVGFIDCTSTENGYSEHWQVGKVLWDEETASFQVTERLSAESYEVLEDCKVIGNVIDNPELLEVGE